jgi:hypothetical protein
MKVPDRKLPEHTIPQFIPVGSLTTVPVPVPVFVTSITLYPGAGSNVALMLRSSVMVTVQGAVPLQPPPPQPLKVTPALWLVLNVTNVPIGNGSAQSVPQLMPAGPLITVPLVARRPVFVTVNSGVLVSRNCADTVEVLFTVQSAPPVHASVHWTKAQSGTGTADNTTFVSASNRPEQVAVHSIPGGFDLTVPPPSGTTLTVTMNVGARAISTETVAPGVKSASVFPE